MLFQRINRTDAEKVFMIVQNVSGSTATQGYNVVLDVGANTDGVRVTQASSTDLQAYIGAGVTPQATSGDAKSFGFLCEAISASSSSQYNLTAKAFIRAL